MIIPLLSNQDLTPVLVQQQAALTLLHSFLYAVALCCIHSLMMLHNAVYAPT